MDQVVEKEVRVDEQVKDFNVDVNVNEEFLENPNDKIYVCMTPIKNEDGAVTKVKFGSNHKLVDEDLNLVVEHMRHWIKNELANIEVIQKLQELDRMQYSNKIPCNELGVAVARLYEQYLSR